MLIIVSNFLFHIHSYAGDVSLSGDGLCIRYLKINVILASSEVLLKIHKSAFRVKFNIMRLWKEKRSNNLYDQHFHIKEPSGL